MALQTTGLEFFYLSVDFFENDKILLVEQELGSRATLLVLRLLAPSCFAENQPGAGGAATSAAQRCASKPPSE